MFCYTGSIRDGYFQYAWSPHWAWVQGFPVEANKWYHAAVVYDGATQKVYKNGKKEFERTQIGAITQNGYGLVLGDRPSYAAPFKGEIDEVRVWSTARTQEEIFGNKDHPITGQETGLVGYWPCDEKSGQILYDHSPNRWHGQIQTDISRDARRFNPSYIVNPTQKWLAFDGVDDHITVPADVWFSGGDFTIESWVYLDDYNSYAKVIDFGNGQFNDTVSLCTSLLESL